MSFPTYHKIQSVFMRDPATNHKTFLLGEYTCPEFEYLAGLEWEWTEKVDGTNIRVGWNGVGVRFGGRSDNAQIPAFLYDVLADKFTADAMAEAFPELGDGNAILYGEGYGAKIQGGGNYKPDGVDFILFDVQVGGVWLRRDAVEDVASKLGIGCVADFGRGTLHDAVSQVQEWAAGQAPTSRIPGANARIEGLVMRPAVDLIDRMGRRIITKLKVKDFAQQRFFRPEPLILRGIFKIRPNSI